MRIVLQRVKNASVSAGGRITGSTSLGFLLLVGISPDDNEEVIAKAGRKIANLRIFEDEQGKMNLALKDVKGKILAVSQFTLYADWRKGNRPSFIGAAEPEKAEILFNKFVEILKSLDIEVETGVFGAKMEVNLVNLGPVTMFMEFD